MTRIRQIYTDLIFSFYRCKSVQSVSSVFHYHIYPCCVKHATINDAI